MTAPESARPVSLRLRQVALAAGDVERATADITAVFDVGPPYADPGVGVFGLRNTVFAFGDTFLEIVSPLHDDAPAARFLARKGGDAGYMAIFQTDDLARERRRIERLGARIVFETAFEDIATVHLHPRDVGGAIVSLDEARPPQSWRWAGPSWTSNVRTAVTGAICGVEVAARDAAAAAARWSRVLGVPFEGIDGPQDSDLAGDPHGANAADGRLARRVYEIRLEAGRVVFVACRHERDEGIAVIEIDARDPERIRDAAARRGLRKADDVAICGTTFRLT